MNETPFGTFIALISFDRDILALETERKTLDKEIQIHQDQEKKLHTELETAKKSAQEAQKAVDAKELDGKTLEQQEAAKKIRLENVTNHKEYQSVNAEIEKIKTKQHELEKDLLHAWSTLESRKKNYEQKKEAQAGEVARLQEVLAGLTVKRSELTARIDAMAQERPAKEKTVPAEWLEKYAAMRSRVADPVVPVINGNCSACYYKVSDQDMMLLSRNRLLQCKDCYRFLYLDSPDHKTDSITS